jgi:hypothetical protein
MPLKPFHEEDEDVWVIEDALISETRPNIRISVNCEGEAPESIINIEKLIENIEPII